MAHRRNCRPFRSSARVSFLKIYVRSRCGFNVVSRLNHWERLRTKQHLELSRGNRTLSTVVEAVEQETFFFDIRGLVLLLTVSIECIKCNVGD